jgi:hypothetical protein
MLLLPHVKIIEKRPKKDIKSLIFMHPESTQRSTDHQKLDTRKNRWKSPKIKHDFDYPKILRKYLVFRHPKMGFIFWSRPIGASKIHWGFPLSFNVETLQAFGALFQIPQYYRKFLYYKTKILCNYQKIIRIWNNRKKILFKSLGFQHPKMALFFISEPGQLGT